jgi:EmrB/QacA subfamily drug resistance transporter
VLAAAILGSSMAFIDGSVVNLALPQLQTEMNATIVDAQWIVEAYALLLSALLLVGGALGDRFGRRRVFAVGTGLFAAASIACGLAPGVGVLIAARAVQGVGGALLVPGSLAIISASFGPADRGRAIGIWSGFSAMSAGLGPVIGGWLVEHLSWRWAFLVNAPIAVAVIAIAILGVPESRDDDAPPGLDWAGATLATLGLGGIVFGLIESATRGFQHPLIVGSLAGGALALAGFVAVERRSTHPMMPLALFSSRAFTGANLLTLLLYAGLGAMFFFLPFNLIQVQGYTATATGAALLPFILIMFVLSRWSGGLVDRFGGRGPLVIGPIIAALGFAGLGIPGVGGSYWSTFFVPIVVMGLGLAVAVAPLTTVVMGSVADRYAGAASGVNNAIARAAGLLAIAVLTIVVSATFNARLDRTVDALALPPASAVAFAVEREKLAGASMPGGLDPATTARLREGVQKAFVDAFRQVALISAVLALASSAVAWITIDGRRATR